MRTHIDCFPCFLRQTVIALRQHPGPEDLHAEILKGILPIIRDADTSRPPAYVTTLIHRHIRDALGADPFSGIKRRYNSIAMELYPGLKQTVACHADPLWAASRLAIAGNVIDFGIFTSVDIEGSVKRSLENGIAADDYQGFREALTRARAVLYLLDNCGEIVFDRLLIEELVSSGKKVSAVVKGSPVLNDVTMEDAFQTGLDQVCEVIPNGSDAIGTILAWTPPEFRDRVAQADLVISKGQGNFETFTDDREKTFFLFQAKCDVLSRELGMPKGSMLLMKG